MRAVWNCHALAGRKGKLTRAIEPDGKGGFVYVIRGVDKDGVPFRFGNGQAPRPAPAAAAPEAAVAKAEAAPAAPQGEAE
jgi:hypothetical protein